MQAVRQWRGIISVFGVLAVFLVFGGVGHAAPPQAGATTKEAAKQQKVTNKAPVTPRKGATPKAPTQPKPASQPASKPTSQPAQGQPGAWPKGLDLPKLHKELEALRKKHKMQGFGYAIVSPTKIWVRGVGMADVAKKRPMKPETLFRIGSVTKSFVALGMLKLLAEKKISLEAPIRKWVGKGIYQNQWAKTDPIRIVHLLEHTAGFDDMHFPELYNVKHKPQIGLEEMLRLYPASRRARWRPGTWVSYSNPGYSVAGHVMEKIAKEPLSAYITRHLLQPLGMKTSTLQKTKQADVLLAQGYIGKEVVAFRHIYHRPAGAMLSSPREMAIFVQMLLNRGKVGGKQLFREAWIKRMETPKSALHVRKGQPMGYGLGSYASNKGGLLTHGHDGGIDGFLSVARYSLTHGLGCVLLFNNSGNPGMRDVGKRLRKALKSAKKATPIKAVKVPRQKLQRWVGTYQQVHSRNALFAHMDALSWIRISIKDGKLFEESFQLLGWGAGIDLLPVGKGLFRSPVQPTGSRLFTTHKGKALFFRNRIAFQKRPSWRPLVYGISVVFALLMILSSLLFSLVWVPRKLFLKREIQYLRGRVVALLASVSLLAGVISMISAKGFIMFTYPSANAILFCVFTGLFGVLSFAGLGLALYDLRRAESNIVARVFCLLASVANVGLVLWFWPMIGVRFWAG